MSVTPDCRHIWRTICWRVSLLSLRMYFFARAELLVNASGIGVDGGESPIPVELLPDDRYVLDLVLSQEPTPLMRAAKERGGRAANGQGAFLASASATVKLLTGSAPPMETLRAALAGELGVPEDALAVVGD